MESNSKEVKSIIFDGGEFAGQSCSVNFEPPNHIALQVDSQWSTYNLVLSEDEPLRYGHAGTAGTPLHGATKAIPTKKGNQLIELELDE